MWTYNTSFFFSPVSEFQKPYAYFNLYWLRFMNVIHGFQHLSYSGHARQWKKKEKYIKPLKKRSSPVNAKAFH